MKKLASAITGFACVALGLFAIRSVATRSDAAQLQNARAAQQSAEARDSFIRKVRLRDRVGSADESQIPVEMELALDEPRDEHRERRDDDVQEIGIQPEHWAARLQQKLESLRDEIRQLEARTASGNLSEADREALERLHRQIDEVHREAPPRSRDAMSRQRSNPEQQRPQEVGVKVRRIKSARVNELFEIERQISSLARRREEIGGEINEHIDKTQRRLKEVLDEQHRTEESLRGASEILLPNHHRLRSLDEKTVALEHERIQLLAEQRELEERRAELARNSAVEQSRVVIVRATGPDDHELETLRIAFESLTKLGMHDEAHKIAGRIHQLESARPRVRRGHDAATEQIRISHAILDNVRDLREEVRGLRQEMHQLREMVQSHHQPGRPAGARNVPSGDHFRNRLNSRGETVDPAGRAQSRDRVPSREENSTRTLEPARNTPRRTDVPRESDRQPSRDQNSRRSRTREIDRRESTPTEPVKPRPATPPEPTALSEPAEPPRPAEPPKPVRPTPPRDGAAKSLENDQSPRRDGDEAVQLEEEASEREAANFEFEIEIVR